MNVRYDKIDENYAIICNKAASDWIEAERQADEEFNSAIAEARRTRDRTKKLARQLYDATINLAIQKKSREYETASTILLEKERTQ